LKVTEVLVLVDRRVAALALGWALAAAAPASALEVTSPDVAPGATLAKAQVHSQCDGDNVSPALAWSGAPAATKSFVVTLFDPDAQGGWWHWIVYDIPAAQSGLPRGAGAGELPAGAHMGRNDFGKSAYGGACPPPGSGAHHYRFTVWALGTTALPVEGATEGQIIGPYLNTHALASASLTAVYER
jgi:Raf kinase inhibitor-like YbhB/YbcL family protein